MLKYATWKQNYVKQESTNRFVVIKSEILFLSKFYYLDAKIFLEFFHGFCFICQVAEQIKQKELANALKKEEEEAEAKRFEVLRLQVKLRNIFSEIMAIFSFCFKLPYPKHDLYCYIGIRRRANTRSK